MPLSRKYPVLDLNYDDLDSSAHEFSLALGELAPLLDIPLVERAYRFAWGAHKGQVRKSGEPYIIHPVSVSLICATQYMDTTTVIATLLHDVVEDTPISIEDIETEFGTPVAQLVDGVTKISSMHTDDKQTQQVETYRKMLLTTAQDIRVIIIKFADRIHNLQTLEHMPQEKRRAIARESLDIYAPLAQRLGMRTIKTELEDLAFKHLHPKDYEEVLERARTNQEGQQEIIDAFKAPIEEALEQAGVDADVIGRQKHLYSIYNKYQVRKVPYEEIYDILAMRVICGTREQCYQILGILHKLWTPLPEKLKDYIASPKPNGYQSIHTTVSDKRGNIMEIQIRTWNMHYIAEEGVAAHWRYKTGADDFGQVQDTRVLSWLRNLVEWQKEFSDSVEFYEFFKVDIGHREISVYTPKKQEVYMPMGATVLDFAYTIHSDLGNHCIGAKINGHVESRGQELQQGDVVTILTDHTRSPLPSWLNDTHTPRARSAIRRWLSKAEKTSRIAMGKQILYGAFEYLDSPQKLPNFIPEILKHFSVPSEDLLYDRIGAALLEVDKVISYLRPIVGKSQPAVSRLMKKMKAGKNTPHVVVNGMDDVMVRYADCCHPLPGDDIVGFLTSGRGISVHRRDCSTTKLFANDRDRMVKLSWSFESTEKRMRTKISLRCKDRQGLLKDIVTVIDQHNLSIDGLTTKTKPNHVTMQLRLYVTKLADLEHLIEHINRVDGVVKISRDKS